MSIVTQRPILFSIPLRDNLTIGRPDAAWDEVLAASEAAGVAAFVDDLPDGYDTHDRRARRQPVRRPAPASRAGAGAAGRVGRDPDGRPAVGGRHRDRAHAAARPSGRRCAGARCWSQPSGCRRWCWPTARSCCETARSSSRARRPSWPRRAGTSRRCSETRRVRHSHRSGLSRLTTYLEGRRVGRVRAGAGRDRAGSLPDRRLAAGARRDRQRHRRLGTAST